jgi:ABC-2 type transport system permease protein
MSAVPPPAMVPFQTVFQLVFVASVKELIRRRRLVFIGLAGLLPLLFVAVWRAWGAEPNDILYLDAGSLLTNLVSSLYLGVLVYLVGIAFGVPTVHDEVEGRTLTYLLTRPISRIAVYAGRLAAVQLLAGVLLALSLVACFLFAVAGNEGVLTFDLIKAYVNHVWVILLATVIMVGLFAVIGTVFRRPLVWSFLYAFAWEGIVSKVPGRLQTWTLDFHLRNLLLREDDVQASLLDGLKALLIEEVEISAWASLGILIVALVGFSLLGGWIFSRREYVIQ